jgi:predicted hotdog family 3-hydroxylacyl-ACP dehydratase
MTLDEVRALPLTELLPHRPPMVLLDRLVHLEPERLEAEVTLTEASPFCEDGRVGAWVGLEYMAQAVAALAGARSRLEGRPPRVGLLLGTREYRSEVPHFLVGQVLRVCATQVFFDPQGVSAMACTIDDAPTRRALARASLTGIEVEDFTRFLKEHRT